MTESFNFGWESDHTPLVFQVSILTARPPRQLSSHCPSSKGLTGRSLDHGSYCGHVVIKFKLK